MLRYDFEKLTVKGSKKCVCKLCGKKLKRSKTFMNTLSPFNKNPDGTVCNREEVYKKIEKQLSEWQKDPIDVCNVECEVKP